ncbi:unnamed protein product [Brugia pahangi]|uniref:Uncharacterized protein n=1 Tax=Brugia pahangi TaxID=6280 RepID=A0A0N4TFY0_BRUPA|nr:unnamed protein product [Brugia pahangi]
MVIWVQYFRYFMVYQYINNELNNLYELQL